MGTRRYSDTDILDMLLRLDAGTRLSEREMHALSERTSLSLRDIIALPESLGQLQALQRLDLSVTRITKLPESLGQLPALRYLNLSHLKLDQIPRSLAHSKLPFYNFNNNFLDYLHADTETGIILYRTTLSEQDVSIFVEHPELIPSLYEDQVTLRECKVIFLGDGESGKSYTIARFLNEGKKETPEHPYVTSETPGVEIKDYHVKRENFDIHFWDFGGQQFSTPCTAAS